MTQKVVKVGASAAVIIPKKSLEELRLKVGDQVSVNFNKTRRTITLRADGALTDRQEKIARLTFDFINRYRKDLEALARK